MKTSYVKPADIKKQWVIVDASGKTLGRLASEISHFLRGKHKPSFSPNWDCGDNVIVINAKSVHLTGQKLDKKFYYHHSTYIGGLKAISARDLLQAEPEKLIKKAVRGMLPKNALARHINMNLKVYADENHPHLSQKPVPMPSRLMNHKGA